MAKERGDKIANQVSLDAPKKPWVYEKAYDAYAYLN